MSILIRKKDQEVKLIFKDNINFITEDFLGLIVEISELDQELRKLRQQIETIEKASIQAQNELQTLKKEQKNTDAKIKKILASRADCYKGLGEKLHYTELQQSIKMLENLLNKMKCIDFNVLQLTMQVKRNSRVAQDNIKQQEDIEQKNDALRHLFQIEFEKINWKRLGDVHICLSPSFEKVQNEKLKQLLKNITNSNIELEKSIILIISRASTKILNNKKTELIKITSEITMLLKMNNMIYDFIDNLLFRNNITTETIYLLQQIEFLLKRLNNYAKNSLTNAQTIDMASSIVHLRSISELNKKTVIQKHCHNIFYKKRLKSYNLDSSVVLSIISELERHLKCIEQANEPKIKTIF